MRNEKFEWKLKKFPFMKNKSRCQNGNGLYHLDLGNASRDNSAKKS